MNIEIALKFENSLFQSLETREAPDFGTSDGVEYFIFMWYMSITSCNMH